MSTQASVLEKSLDLAIPLADVETEVESRLKRLVKTIRLEGFRPGKVPLSLVQKQYGGQVRQDVLSDAAQRTFADAVNQQHLRVAGVPHFASKAEASASAGKFEFTATFEVYPEVVVGDVSSAVIRKPETEVSDADVDRTLEVLRKQRIRYQPVARPAAVGDEVEMDFRGFLDGVEFPGGTGTAQKAILGEGRLLPEFEANLAGLAANDAKSFELTFPADYHGTEVAGKTARFEVTVRRVSEGVLPPVDAEFARTLGIESGDLELMRTEIRNNLAREVKKRIQARVKDQVMQALSDATPLTLPKALVEQEIDRLREAALQELRQRPGKQPDVALPAEMFTDQAQRRVKLGLILAEIVQRQQLQAKPEQVRALLEEHAQSYEDPAEMVRWYYQQPERLKEVEAVVLEENVVNWVTGVARVEMVPTAFSELVGNRS